MLHHHALARIFGHRDNLFDTHLLVFYGERTVLPCHHFIPIPKIPHLFFFIFISPERNNWNKMIILDAASQRNIIISRCTEERNTTHNGKMGIYNYDGSIWWSLRRNRMLFLAKPLVHTYMQRNEKKNYHPFQFHYS